MSWNPSDSAIKVTPSLEERLAKATSAEIPEILKQAAIDQGLAKRDWDPSILVPAEQSATFKKSFTINGQTRTIEGATELELAQAETVLFKSLMDAPAPAAAAAEPARGTDGRVVNAENAVDVEELRMQMIQGTITPEEFVARAGIIERVVDQRAERATVTGWETATASFLNSPEGQNWPGGAALSRIQQILTANHLEDAEDKLEALKSAWLFMQQQDYETQINEKLRTATPDELREAIGYGRSSGMFGQR